ncbi:Cd(II)/Pb(II)-responsive transcriptional regulator [Hydrocarboniclastica marina]|uniref:Cd(II)/Pb(II)-responsive transcriptional regulator n=1 Tax=Hydrocarboniclastica marina TaxID=2259620 RepID=A0A4P7XFK7_9ALTE|nr:Cd(II)/Pb(II)-responsive transcriptional regulator [Hydrocarboniclastica marina]QCF25383.1 Cd(II)/Pb(II)-responsive transcriptional regulator [Hydrocarboniclastica marina]
MKIGQLAKRINSPVETIRYWEKEGLLPEPKRSDGNYRVYTDAHLERLLFVRNCRTLDMSLNEIRELLRLWDRPQEDCGEVNELIDSHTRHVVAQIDALRSLEAQLRELRQRCTNSRAVENCGIIEGLTTGSLPCGSTTGTHMQKASCQSSSPVPQRSR